MTPGSAIARGASQSKHKEIVEYLKAEHGLSHGYANQIAIRALAAADAPAAGSDDLVDAQYQGRRPPCGRSTRRSWRPCAFGPDVEFTPKKAYVSLRRSKQFGLIQPSTATRVDVGLILKGVPPAGRLESLGQLQRHVHSSGESSNVAEVDRELIGWLRRAYEGA